MKLHSSRFGEVNVEESQILCFPNGIPGFPSINRYVLLDDPENLPFQWLQAVEDPKLAFLVINPFFFKPDYRFDIPDPILSLIDTQHAEDVGVLIIIAIQPKTFRLTANLQAPLVIGARTRRGAQVVLVSGPYHTRHDILEEMGVKAGSEADRVEVLSRK